MNRIVIKIGSSSIVDESNQRLFNDRISSIVEDIFWLREELNKDVILMSSGALSWGRVCMSGPKQDLIQNNQQLTGACGQIGISSAWASAVQKQGAILGQLLLTPENTSSPTILNTLNEMLTHGIIPYINENIPIMQQYDNDFLASEVARQLQCDTVILLSDVEGVYSANPKIDKTAYLINEIENIDEAIALFGGESSTNMGTGGMFTKLKAAKSLGAVGVDTIIGSGEVLNPIKSIINGKSGTIIKAK